MGNVGGQTMKSRVVWASVVTIALLECIGCSPDGKQKAAWEDGRREITQTDDFHGLVTFDEVWFEDGGKEIRGTIASLTFRSVAGRNLPVSLASKSVDGEKIETADLGVVYFKAPRLGGGVRLYLTDAQINQIKGTLDYESRIRDLTKVIKLNPNDSIAYTERGRIYYMMNDYKSCIEDLSVAIGLKPNNSTAYTMRGRVYKREGDDEAAIRDLTKAIEIDPKNSEAYMMRADAFVGIHQLPKAIEDFSEIIRLTPDDGEAYETRARAYLLSKEFDKMASDCQKCRELGHEVDEVLLKYLPKQAGRQ